MLAAATRGRNVGRWRDILAWTPVGLERSHRGSEDVVIFWLFVCHCGLVGRKLKVCRVLRERVDLVSFPCIEGGFGFGLGVLWKLSVSFPRAAHTGTVRREELALRVFSVRSARAVRLWMKILAKDARKSSYKYCSLTSPSPLITPARTRSNSLNPSFRYPSWHHPSTPHPAGEASPILLLRRPAHLGWTDRSRQMHLILRHPDL